MAELIDRNAFWDFWCKNYRHQYANDTFLVAIANFPTTDAVPVVRCKDCKWYTLKKNVAYNGHFCDKIIEFVKPDDFCSFVERRTND